MTTDLEREFFKTFDIETKEKFYCLKGYCNQNPSVKTNSPKCRECKNGNYYTCPEITDRILLSLIKIICKENIISLTRMKNGSKEWAVYFGLDKNCIFYEKSFKNIILKGFIEYSNDIDIYTRVQELFKEQNYENKNIN